MTSKLLEGRGPSKKDFEFKPTYTCRPVLGLLAWV